MTDQAARLRELVRGQLPKQPASILSKARTLVITSGKGGVGKTNITVNLALVMASRGKRVILFDADMGMANVDVILKISPPFTMADVIAGRKALSEILFPIEGNLAIVPGGSGVAQLASLEPTILGQIVVRLADLEDFADLILVDTGAGISPNVLGFVLASREVIVITTPEPTAIVDAYGIIKTLDARNRDAKISLVVNMVDSESEARNVFSKVSGIIKRFLAVQVELLGWVEKDGNVGRSVLQQQPFTRKYPYSLASKRVHLIATALLAQESGVTVPSTREGFFNRLGRALLP